MTPSARSTAHLLRSTSWGGRRSSAQPGPQVAQSTSWSSRRPRRTVATAVAAMLAAALPATAGVATAAAPTTRVVVVGNDAGALTAGLDRAARTVADAAVAELTAAEVETLRRQGLHVVADAPVRLTAETDDDDEPAAKQKPAKAEKAEKPKKGERGDEHDDEKAAKPAKKQPAPVRRISVAEQVGAAGLANRGAGTTIAVIDSGVDEVPSLAGRMVQGANFTSEGFGDAYGHGTFVAGLAAGDGRGLDGASTGIEGVAPQAVIVSVKVADARGSSTVGQVVLGLAWTIEHQQRLGIDVVNLALTTDVETSYDYNPVNALVEAAWFSGMTVIASAGNNGKSVSAAPGNDPWALTIGSLDDHNTVARKDDSLSSYSNSGQTLDGFAKPEVTATGQHVQGPLPVDSRLADRQKRDLGLPAGYGQLSGTSMATGVASGAAALVHAARAGWTNEQVKTALVSTRSKHTLQLQVDRALESSPGRSVNAGLRPSVALAAAYAELIMGTTDYASVDYSAVDWWTVSWVDATWTNATWTNATWTNATWTSATWTNATWTSATWTSATWTSATWTSTAE